MNNATTTESKETGKKKHSPQRILLRGNASLTEEAAQLLIQFKVLLMGFEPDGVFSDADGQKTISRILLSGRVILLTGLDLDNIDDGEYLLNASPVLIPDSGSAPCRAYLVRSPQSL